MERTKWYEAQVEKITEMVECRDEQFHNLYKEMLKNRKDIRQCAKLISGFAEVIKKTKEE